VIHLPAENDGSLVLLKPDPMTNLGVGVFNANWLVVGEVEVQKDGSRDADAGLLLNVAING